jgi:predicted nucleic acid-binding protein
VIAVLDASAGVDAVTPGERGLMARRIVGACGRLVTPALFDLEFCSTLARMERAGQLGRSQLDRAFEALNALRLQRYDMQPLAPSAWSMRDSVRIADGFYVALAQLLGCPLITSDGRLAQSNARNVAFILVT